MFTFILNQYVAFGKIRYDENEITMVCIIIILITSPFPPLSCYILQLMFHVDNGAGRFSAIYKPDKPGSLCDGRWHKVTANKIKHRLELTVDGSEVDGSSPNGGSSSTDTNDPVFVGGYPGECPTHKQGIIPAL